MRDFARAKRVIIKIGTNTLACAGGIDAAYIKDIAGQICGLIDSGRQPVIITSGAIGMGAAQLKLPLPVKEIKMRQACAAIGQPLLMAQYHSAFAHYNTIVAQVLLTAEVLNNRKTYLNLRNSIETLLKMRTIPVLNENDSVSTAEIGSAFGDNDSLSALVASKLDADLLIILSDIDALYDKDPRRYADAEPVKIVYEITEQIIRSAGSKGSACATGGMKTKINAAKIASNAGCRVVIANGRRPNIITGILAGEDIGTVFMPRRRLSNRLRWILNSTPAGTIKIDNGAISAVQRSKSLLPSGVTGIEGSFEPGQVVMLNDIAKAVTSLGSEELKILAGKHSSLIRRTLGPDRKDVVASPEDIVFLDY